MPWSIRTAAVTAGLAACLAVGSAVSQPPAAPPAAGPSQGEQAADKLPAPFATPSARKPPKVIGWPDGRTPVATDGLRVSLFARGLVEPRWPYVLPNGDVLVAQSKARKIALLRDADGDGTPEVRETLIDKGLDSPFGLALLGDTLYVANTDSLVAFPYKSGQTKIDGAGVKVLDLPKGGYNNHWTRNVVVGPDGKKLYVTVGSASNVGEHGTAEEMLRANVLEVNPDGTALRVFASGLRNPVGLDFEPTTKTMWTAVNERDGLGDDLVPDYMTSVRDGAFYGWPYSYYGKTVDPRRKGERPDLVAKSLVPDVPLGSHTASLGLHFLRGTGLPDRYRGGAFVGQHGSWNRSQFAGYKVVFVPFSGGKPSGPPEDFLTGFVANDNEVYGRPVGVAEAKDGSLMVTDDAGACVWRVSRANGGVGQ